MAQHDYIISNQTFPNTRADINNVLSAIASNNSGTSAPTTQYAGQFWIDTTSSTWTLYIHDGADDIQFATIDTSANTVNFTDSALDVVTDTSPQLGGNLDLNSNDITGTGNINITGNLTATGNLTSTGIDDNATSTAITIDSNETSTLQCSAGDSNFALLAYHPTATSTRTIAKFQSNLGGTQEDKVVIQTNGYVGIGESSPEKQLHVNSGTTDEVIRIVSTSIDALIGAFDNTGSVYFGNSGSNGAFGVYTGGNTSGAGSSEKMRIDSSGRVGIGTSSPGQQVTIAVDDSNTGIGNGRQNLELSNTNGTNGTYSRILFNDIAGGPASGIFASKLTDTTNNYGQFEFYTRGSSGGGTRMVIDPNGNVGIGTTSPSQKLDVVGSIEVSDGIYIGGTGTANKLDDYEEGTWTPEYEPDTGDPFTSISYDFRYATYTKVGRQVTCLLAMRTSALTKGTASGSLSITGLPFTVGSTSDLRTYNPVGVGVDWLVNNPSNIRPNHTNTTARIQKDFDNTSIQVSDMSTGGANNFIGLEFTYFTD